MAIACWKASKHLFKVAIRPYCSRISLLKIRKYCKLHISILPEVIRRKNKALKPTTFTDRYGKYLRALSD